MLHPIGPSIALALALGWTAVPARAQAFGEPRQLSAQLDGVTTAVPVDVDGDGDLDVVACSRQFPGVRIHWNAGGGQFAGLETVIPDFGDPRGVAGGDLDGDGDVDLLVSGGIGPGPGSMPRGLWFVEASAPGVFLAPQLLAETFNAGERVEIFDLDGDGDLDATSGVWSPISQGAFLVENLGGGALLPRLLGEGYDHTIPADVDGDGRLDLVGSSQSGFLLWSRSRAPMVYESPRFIGIFAGDGRIAAGDLDGDGLPEVVGSRRSVGEMLVFPNVGGGQFGDRVVLPVPSDTRHEHVLVDVDLDGDLDIVVAAEIGDGPQWFESDGALGFSPAQPLVPGFSTACEDLRVADIDGDGLRDLLFAVNESRVVWLRGDASVSSGVRFETAPRPVSSGIAVARDVVALDVEGDGDGDIVAASASEAISVAIRDGLGGYAPWEPALSSLGAARALAVGDLTGDGLADLVVRTEDGRVAVSPAGPGGLGAPIQIADLSGQGGGSVLSLADADGDGDLDVFADEGFDLYLFELVGPGAFAPPVLVGANPFVTRGVAAGDLDGDGVQDLVIARLGPFGVEVVWRPGLSGGGYGVPALLHTGPRDRGAPTIDEIDSDGRDELLIADGASGHLLAIGVSASGVPETPVIREFDLGAVEEIIRRDTDASGRRDDLFVRRVAGPTPATREIVWHPDSFSLFGGEQTVVSGVVGGIEPFAYDLDGDGDLDVGYAVFGGPTVAVVENLTSAAIGTVYCGPAAANSTGAPARITAFGSTRAFFNDFGLRALGLPAGATTLFLSSALQGFTPNLAGSAGDLCLGGNIGRFVAPGQLGPANAGGVREIEVDLQAIPAGSATLAVGALDRLFFQAWYRDGAGSKLTAGLAVQFE